MFWLQRLKQDEHDDAWALSYGDLMSLLMAVFVMIAAMSELRPGAKFSSVRNAVWGAFGFASAPGGGETTDRLRSPALGEQLTRAGLLSASMVPRVQPDTALRCCEVVQEDGRLVIRIAGSAAFEPGSATLRPPALAALRRLAELLGAGQTRLEIRGHYGGGPLSAGALHRDGLDLSYQRGRNVMDVLAQGGVDARRMYISACGDHDPLVTPAPDGSPAASNRRIEIVVHAVSTGGKDDRLAEKGQADGQ